VDNIKLLLVLRATDVCVD